MQLQKRETSFIQKFNPINNRCPITQEAFSENELLHN